MSHLNPSLISYVAYKEMFIAGSVPDQIKAYCNGRKAHVVRTTNEKITEWDTVIFRLRKIIKDPKKAMTVCVCCSNQVTNSRVYLVWVENSSHG